MEKKIITFEFHFENACCSALSTDVNCVYLDVVVHEAASICKIGVFSVYIRQFDGDQVVNLQRKLMKMIETNLRLKEKINKF